MGRLCVTEWFFSSDACIRQIVGVFGFTRELINMEIKVESIAIKEMKNEMMIILQKYLSDIGFRLQKWRSPKGDGVTLLYNSHI